MHASQQGLVFDTVEVAYYRLRGDMFLSDDDAQALELPKEELVIEKYKSGDYAFNMKDKRSIIVDDLFFQCFLPNKMDTFQRNKQEKLDSILKDYEDTLPPDELQRDINTLMNFKDELVDFGTEGSGDSE